MKYKTLNRDDFHKMPRNQTGGGYDSESTNPDDLTPPTIYKAEAHDRCYLLIHSHARGCWHWESWTKDGNIKLGGNVLGFKYRDQAFLSAYMDYLNAQERTAQNIPAEEMLNG